jgi:hypothetical protein
VIGGKPADRSEFLDALVPALEQRGTEILRL